MKPIPLQIQKVIMFIPVINLFNFLIWYYNDFCLKFPRNISFITTLIAGCCMVAILKICGYLANMFILISDPLVFAGYYIAPIAMSLVFIKQQKKLGVQ